MSEVSARIVARMSVSVSWNVGLIPLADCAARSLAGSTDATTLPADLLAKFHESNSRDKLATR